MKPSEVRNSIEFHDSTVSAIAIEAASIYITLDAYVHRWDIVGVIWKGTGWVQPVQITINSTAAAPQCAVPSDLDSGEVHVGDRVYRSLVPIPMESTGPAFLRLLLATGEALEFSGRDLTIAPVGDAQFLEDLPVDFAPRD